MAELPDMGIHHAGGAGCERKCVGGLCVWPPDASTPLGGKLKLEVVTLPRVLSPGMPEAKLSGTFVEVHNAGVLNTRQSDGTVIPLALGDAQSGADGEFMFEPTRGGGRVDKCAVPGTKRRVRYVEASRFGEVNLYYHVDRIAAYLDGLIRELGRSSLPRVIVKVNAH